MSFSSDTYIVRQYLEPLTPEQLKPSYVHTLPSGRTAVNLKDLRRWKRFSHGTGLIELLSVDKLFTQASDTDRNPVNSTQNPALGDGAVLSVDQSKFWVEKTIDVPTWIGQPRSVTDALSGLSRMLNEQNREFPGASYYAVSRLRKRDKGTVYELPNNYQVIAVNSLYHGHKSRPSSGTTLLRMQIDDLWRIEGIWVETKFPLGYTKVYSFMGEQREGCLGTCESEEAVLTIMLDVAIGRRKITDYVVEQTLLTRLSLPAVKASLGMGQTNLPQIKEG